MNPEEKDEIKDWLDMTQDNNRCRACVSAVMNILVLLNARNIITT
jgi:hypothetical protein